MPRSALISQLPAIQELGGGGGTCTLHVGCTVSVRWYLFSPSTHSLSHNSIGNERAKVLSDAMKTMTNLQYLE